MSKHHPQPPANAETPEHPPNPAPTGALVSPRGDDGATFTVSESEYENLKGCLNAIRGRHHRLRRLADAFHLLAKQPDIDFAEFTSRLLSYLNEEDGTELSGMLPRQWWGQSDAISSLTL